MSAVDPVTPVLEQGVEREGSRTTGKVLKQRTYPGPEFCIFECTEFIGNPIISLSQESWFDYINIPSPLRGVNSLMPGHPLFCLVNKEALLLYLRNLRAVWVIEESGPEDG